MDLQQLRDKIDDTDREILSLFMKRMELCKGVADYKKLHNMPVFQEGREQQVATRRKKAKLYLPDVFSNALVSSLWVLKFQVGTSSPGRNRHHVILSFWSIICHKLAVIWNMVIFSVFGEYRNCIGNENEVWPCKIIVQTT